MRKRNKVSQLQRGSAHRKAMVANLVTSFLYHESIESTVAKVKATRIVAEKLITKAKKGAEADSSLHHIRSAATVISDKEVLNKLFKDIAPRNKERNGGYTRVIRTGARSSDNAEMAILELVEKKELAVIKDERKALRESRKVSPKKKQPAKSEKTEKTEK